MEGSLVAYKVFTNGSTLQASEVNENLMQQSVATFSNETARDAAITSPVQGQVTYIEDSNSYQSFDGTTWIGLVPQSANAVINGAFEINQRNFTSNTTTGAFNFDRWRQLNLDGTTTVSPETFTPGTAPIAGYEGRNFLRIVSSGQTATNANSRITQFIESARTFAGQTVTFSFFAKAASGTPKVALEIVRGFGTGGSFSTSDIIYFGQATLTTSWQRFTFTASIPSVTGKTFGTDNNDHLALTFWTSAGSDFNSRTGSIGIQSNTLDFWGVQLEAGSVATPFRRNANSLEGELAACQRYYQRKTGTNLYSLFGFGFANSTTNGLMHFPLPVQMRATPTSIDFSTLRLTDLTSEFPVTSVTLSASSSPSFVQGDFGASGAGLTAQRSYYLSGRNSAAAFVGFSAEL
jgi:hypothetical protein